MYVIIITYLPHIHTLQESFIVYISFHIPNTDANALAIQKLAQ